MILRCGLTVPAVLILLTFSMSRDSAAEPEPEGIPNVADVLFFQYRLVIRDLLDRSCNFSPSCSHFGQEAISGHGPVFGTMMALERWTRCHSSARDMCYYVESISGRALSDPVDVTEGNVVWDSLLLPF